METREAITLDQRAQQRLYVLNHILAGELSATEAAGYLHLSVRSVRRLLARYRQEGASALVHGNRGRVPANRLDDERRARLTELATTTYAGINREHLSELLAEREGLVVPARTLRRVLAEAGLAPVRRRRPPRHRSRRERMPQAGMLLQVDGSRHDWLEGRGPWLTLVGGIDDATGRVTGAVFREQEDTAGYLEVLIQTVHRHGLPLGLYSDRAGIFWKGRRTVPTLAEQFAGKGSTTQLGGALEAAAIAWIAARSPEAKGRVERLWGTAQDRLRVELRLAGASTREEANALLPAWIERHNARFAVAAADPAPAWRPVPGGLEPEELFCFRHGRRVARDGTFTLAGQSLMLVPGRIEPRRLGRRLVISERLDGSRWVEVDGTFHPVIPAPERAATLRRQGRDPGLPAPTVVRVPHRPAPDHPWRRYPAVGNR
jgi:transposase